MSKTCLMRLILVLGYFPTYHEKKKLAACGNLGDFS
ncbi:hypothetical protein BofuT4_uP027080.1 [Botrytis cinerea T4]|uniref:Uncharacterized protein n=1 Tax=Botryotinia fuckeliana (strain T4) TaxID=999810 RepID=G2YAT3_BOTF4|nr:hypothetical protein BofuT4_uP027080.1 [Botrytis cinerea T4]